MSPRPPSLAHPHEVPDSGVKSGTADISVLLLPGASRARVRAIPRAGTRCSASRDVGVLGRWPQSHACSLYMIEEAPP